jgi:hypothetical protein
MSQESTPFEQIRRTQIRRTNPAGNEFWSSRDFAKVLGYVNYRHFQAVIEKAKTACSNSGQRVEDHFVGADQMIEIGSGAQRSLRHRFDSAKGPRCPFHPSGTVECPAK